MFYKADVHRFELSENSKNLINLTINNATIWDYISLTITKDELKGLADWFEDQINSQIESMTDEDIEYAYPTVKILENN